MYNSYFGFSEPPFENILDQRFLFLSKDHREVLATLLYFTETKKGFAIVCGDAGTGKTMLIKSLLDRLPETAKPVIISNPYVNSQDILFYLAKTLEIKTTGLGNVLALIDEIKDALIKARSQNRHVILIIDEAHLLSYQALEEIRLLSNIETPNQKLLQILLVGQYGLSHKLDRHEMRHLRQRINIKRFLSPLNPEEIIHYVDQRLKQVGSSFASVFEDKCLRLIFKMTEGYPPRINQLCDNALLFCMNKRLRKVNRKILKKAHEAWQTDLVFTPKSSKARTYRVRKPNKPLMLAAGSVAVVVLLGIIAIRSGFGLDNFQRVFQQMRSAIQTASVPQAASASKSEALRKPENESTRLSQSGKPEGAPASSLVPSGSAPILSPLSEGFGRTDIEGKLSSGGKESSSPPGKSEMKPEISGEPKLTAEILTPKADSEKPQEAPIEVGRAPSPSPRSSTAQVPSALTQLIAEAGDTLTRIVNRNYPDNKKLGLVALILANPEITNESKISPGQTLYLPEINFDKETIRLRDNMFYTIYGRYLTSGSLKKDTSWLDKRKVHFVLRDTKDSRRNVVYRVFLGGYETEAELEKALQSVKLKSGKGYKVIGQANQSAGRMNNQAKGVSAASTNGPEDFASVKVTEMDLNRGLGNDPVASKVYDKMIGSFNKTAVVGQAHQAAGFANNQDNVIDFNPKGALVALSKVQLSQVNVKNYLDLYKIDGTCKIDKSFNGFTYIDGVKQSTGSINKQNNIVSFVGTK